MVRSLPVLALLAHYVNSKEDDHVALLQIHVQQHALPDYSEVYMLPNVEYIKSQNFKTEAEVQDACNANDDCPGYWVSGTDDVISQYVAFVKGSRAFGLGAPNKNVLHVFAKNAASDLLKLGASDTKYDYAEGALSNAEYFGRNYGSEANAQAACHWVGQPCLGYWKGGANYVLFRQGTRSFKKGSPNAGVESVMVKGDAQDAAPTQTQAEANKAFWAAKKAARKEKKAAKIAAREEKKAARKEKKAKRN